jgi:hypothetical protein
MVPRLRSHLAHNAVGYFALFVALTGTSYAAISLPANSVGTRQLRNGAVTATKVKRGSLVRANFAAGQLKFTVRSIRGPSGPVGPAGPQGPAGPTKVAVRTAIGAAQADGISVGTAVCQAGERAVGGGVMLQGTVNSSDRVVYSRPGVEAGAGGFGTTSAVPQSGDTPTAWTGQMYSAVAGRTLVVYAICASP